MACWTRTRISRGRRDVSNLNVTRKKSKPTCARPALSGFQLLDLHDYLGQGTALIGVVDAFWEPKSYVTAAEFRRFAGPVPFRWRG
jgi:hypothetical protein